MAPSDRVSSGKAWTLGLTGLMCLATMAPGMLCAQSIELSPASESPLGDEMVEINVPAMGKLDALLMLMSRELGIRYQYSAEIGNKAVSIQSPAKVPRKALPFLLSSVLKSENLAIVDGDIAGEKRIIQKENMPEYAPPGAAGEAERIFQAQGAGAPATQIFLLKKLNADLLSNNVIRQFSKSAIPISIPNSNILIVTDYAPNIKKIDELIRQIDSPAGETVYEFYEVRNQTSAALTEQVQSIFGQKEAAGEQPVLQSIRIFDDPKGNRIVVAGRKELVDDAIELLKKFDVELGMETLVYRPKNLSAERLNNIVSGYLPEQDLERAYQGTVDEDGNLLIVRATRKIHEQIKGLLEELDKTTAASDSPIRFYKLKNARANEVLFTLLALQEAYGSSFGGMGMMGGNPFFGGAFGGLGIPGYGSGMMGTGGMGMTGMIGLPIGGIMNSLGTPPLGNQSELNRFPNQSGLPGTGVSNMSNTAGVMGNAGGGTGTGMGGAGMGGAGANEGGRSGGRNGRNQVTPNGAGFAAGGSASLPGGARVSADVGTNSLIVVAPASIQPIYKKLIESLDQRRPQVQIEAKIIAIDTTNGFSLGVETSMGDRTGLRRAFKFTSYGLSKVNPITGALEIIPAQGFNGTVVDPEVADLVIQALSTHSRSRIVAEPKILVNDNQTGTLESLVSIPFQSRNTSVSGNGSDTLGGTQEAGTTINVTPQINEDDNLQLEFDIEFSSFGSGGTDVLPPPRQIQTISSVITIPDGQTVIVGGLKRIGAGQTYAGIPWIEKIPIVRDLTGLTNESNETTSYFVFIRPLIMRDSRFQDLQYVSDKEAGLMGIPSQYPGSQPLLMR